MIFLEIIFFLSLGFIIYTYVGYPLFIWILSNIFSSKKNYLDYEPSITLLIAAYNEEKVIAKKLEQSLKLEYPKKLLQIIVAADGSDDSTTKIVKEFESRGIELSYDSARRGKMSAINRAMENARGEIVLFSDANNDYSPDVFYKIAQPYSDPRVGAVTGSKHIYKTNNFLGSTDGLYWKYESFIKICENRIGCCVGVSGEIFSIRRSLFSSVSERIINDDFYLAMDVIKKGYNIIYAPLAQSFEEISQNQHDENVRRTRIFAGQVQLFLEEFARFPFERPLVLFMMVSHKFFRVLLPVAMISVLLSNFIALMLGSQSNVFFTYNPFLLFFLLQVLFYVCAILGAAHLTTGTLGKFFFIPYFLVNSNFSALLGLFRYFTGKQTVIWKKVARS